MDKKIKVKIGVVSVLLTIVFSLLKWIEGWEILAFSVLTYILLFFSLSFVKYVDVQKSFESLEDRQEG